MRPAPTRAKPKLDALPTTEKEQEGQRRFDLDTSHALYQALIEPVEPLLKGTRRLYVTSSGKLGDLPLALLSTSALPAGADMADPDVLARAQWLANRYAFTSLPSVASLTLARDPRARAGIESFRGYGAPVLLGGDTGSRARRPESGFSTRSPTRARRSPTPTRFASPHRCPVRRSN